MWNFYTEISLSPLQISGMVMTTHTTVSYIDYITASQFLDKL